MSLRPMYDNVIIIPHKAEELTSGGLYISNPDHAKQYAEGEVVAIGDGYIQKDGTVRPLKVKLGDIVIYRKMVEVDISDAIEERYLISEGTILAVKES